MHQILEILIITAGDRIYSLIRISHGIQKSIQAPLCQFNKRILYRKIPAPFQYGMLQNMGNPRTILRRRTKTDIKNLIFIIIGKQRYPGSALFVLQKITHRVQIFYFLFFNESVACHFFNFHVTISPVSIYPFRLPAHNLPWQNPVIFYKYITFPMFYKDYSPRLFYPAETVIIQPDFSASQPQYNPPYQPQPRSSQIRSSSRMLHSADFPLHRPNVQTDTPDS